MPRSPTTTGKVERWHKTLCSDFLNGKVFTCAVEAQALLDKWVVHYNAVRPHQWVGMVTPADRFALAETGWAVNAKQYGGAPNRNLRPIVGSVPDPESRAPLLYLVAREVLYEGLVELTDQLVASVAHCGDRDHKLGARVDYFST